MRSALAVFQTVLFSVSSASVALSQGMPTSQPSMITIVPVMLAAGFILRSAHGFVADDIAAVQAESLARVTAKAASEGPPAPTSAEA